MKKKFLQNLLAVAACSMFVLAMAGTTTVGSLGTCDATAKGARHFVTDSNTTTFMATAADGGANNVPVVCDGTNWVIG